MTGKRDISFIRAIRSGIGAAVLATAAAPMALAAPIDGDATEIVYADDIDWGALNPARGENSPRAGNLWGDRAADGASGFLVRFNEGFASPPHIHNVTYRGVVISGEIHNDDPGAADMWLPKGSFWTQPAGEAHITAASGATNIAYVETDEGPYLVQPEEEAFDNGERPVNIETSNLVWLGADSLSWIPVREGAATSAEITFLWGQPGAASDSGYMLRLQDGFSGTLTHEGRQLRAVLIDGDLDLAGADRPLQTGGYFGMSGQASQSLTCAAEDTCLIYVRASDRFTLSADVAQQ
ncbi:MAG: DUF4437 domain-containing protein [Henriciella sp.]|nr:DUF4437 domain-containing protein [Henriciella sp.]